MRAGVSSRGQQNPVILKNKDQDCVVHTIKLFYQHQCINPVLFSLSLVCAKLVTRSSVYSINKPVLFTGMESEFYARGPNAFSGGHIKKMYLYERYLL